MSAPILLTKFFIPPTRKSLVNRPRLIQQLDEGLDLKMTLISAPAGFGKTTLISHWVELLKHNQKFDSQTTFVAWLSLDDDDNDPARFLTYFCMALNRISDLDVEIGQGALNMLRSPQPPPANTVLISLINDLAAITEKVIFVLDDYQLIEAALIHQALFFLLENLPPQLHLVIATRHDPPLSLGRLRAQAQMTELRAADLCFSSLEAADFLNHVMGLNLSSEDIAKLETRTEGWIAGLQLAAISMQGNENPAEFIESFTGGHRLVLDFLIEEVMRKQSESDQNFLLHTSILTQMTGPLCDSLTGQDNGQETLETFDRGNLFTVPLDEERRWYRYHHLFADFLRQQLGQTQPEKVSSLHHKASEWYEQNGLIDKAIDHALSADEFEQAANLIQKQANKVWDQGEHTKLRHWLKALPEKIVFTKPELSIFNAWTLFLEGLDGAAERCLEAAEQELDIRLESDLENIQTMQGKSPGSNQLKIRGRAEVIRASIASHQRDMSGIIQHTRQALEYLPKGDSSWRNIAAIILGDIHAYKGDMSAVYKARKEELDMSRQSGNIYAMMIASLKLALILRLQGDLQQALRICQQQLERANESGLSHTAIAGGILATLGELLTETNKLDEGLQQAKRGINLIEPSKDFAMLIWSYACITRVLLSRGEIADAEMMAQKGMKLAHEVKVPSTIADLPAVWQARLWIAQGKQDAASHWVKERGLQADGKPTFQNELEYITYVRLLILQGHLDEATRLLQTLLENAKSGGRIARVIEILILQSLVSEDENETHQAVTALEKALNLAEPGGFCRIFIDEGSPMASLLYEALNCGIASEYVQRLIATFPDTAPKGDVSSKTQVDDPGMIEPLSDREIDVLRLVAKGLTNKVIAERLYLSIHTIKSHTRNIYGKLGVNNRTQAVNKARTLGILPTR